MYYGNNPPNKPNQGDKMSEYKVVEVSTSKEIDGEKYEVIVNMDAGDNLTELTERYGEEVVFEYAIRALKVRLQAQVRADIKAFAEGSENATPLENISEKYIGWKPDIQRTKRKDPKASLIATFESLSAEERENVLAQLRAQAEALAEA